MENIFKNFYLELSTVISKMSKVTLFISGFSLAFSILIASYVSWIYFTQDEDLLSEVVELLKPVEKIPDAENIAIYGLGLRAEGDPLKAGTEIVAAYEDAIRQRTIKETNDIESPKIDSYLGFRPLSMLTWDSKICNLIESKCLKKYQNLKSEFLITQKQNTELIARYEKLKSIFYFQFPLPIDIAISDNSLSELSKIASFKLVEVSIALDKSNEANGALRTLEEESKLWRRLLAQSPTLISKMISSRIVREQMRLASEIILIYPELVKSNSDLFARVTSLLSAEELKNENALIYELKSLLLLIRNTFEYVHLINPNMNSDQLVFKIKNILFSGFKLNTSLNSMYKINETHRFELKKSAKEVFKYSISDKLQVQKNGTKMKWFFSVNPIGEFMRSGELDYSNYSLRIHDLDAYVRLVETQRLISAQKIEKKNILAFLSKLGTNLQDPYTESPLAWNEETSTLSVQTKATYTVKQAPAEVIIK